MFSLREHDRANGIWGGGEPKNNWSENCIFCLCIPIFNGSIIMSRGLQVSSFSMLFICL